MPKLLAFSPAVPEPDRKPEGMRDSILADNLANLRDHGTPGRDALTLTAEFLGWKSCAPASIAQAVARFNAACAEAGHAACYALAHKVEGVRDCVRLTLVTREEYEAKSAAARKAANS